MWLHAVSDLLIAAAYFSIPAALLSFLRRRSDLAFKPVFGLFAAFILACGMTHVMGAVTLWVPAYWADGALKALTAALSIATAIVLWPLIPRALAVPSPVSLRQANEALAHEVRQRDDTEHQLRANKERLHQLYARTPAALHAVDPDGVIIDVSDRWLDLVGYRRDEVVGRPVSAFYTADSAQISADHLSALRGGGDLLSTERRLVRRDGDVREVIVLIEVERDEAGELERVLAVVTDVTEVRATQAALLVAEERLHHAQKMEAVGQLTGGIAHDFNNLLTSIMGSVELLQERANLPERDRRFAVNAMSAARKAARLTSQLLSFSRQQRLSPEARMPGELVAGMHELLARPLGNRITLHVVEEEGPGIQWPVLADPNQIESALLNLVINARDAIIGAGRITISIGNRTIGTRDGPAAVDHPETLAAGEYVSLRVTDTGAGMTNEVRSHAFEPFFTTKPAGTGTGLGLSQVYGFVTQSGGAVQITSAPGRGTNIEILLPRGHGLAQSLTSEHTPEITYGAGEHILMVEDDDLLRRTIAEALESRGFVVVQAADGPEALRLLDGSKAVVLFTDVRMPGGLSGVELARAVRARQPSLPVLFASGFAEAGELDQWDTPDVLRKPYSIEEAVSGIMTRVMKQREAFPIASIIGPDAISD